ncbi:lysophospholipid acyltransferase family protein [Vampirovibrio sp.]|uniref:lysophospholipid acyltransferase family protein n=1 Tax=Vampirovibrio sp. TaxID=2717857 RepID=UPI0035931963
MSQVSFTPRIHPGVPPTKTANRIAQAPVFQGGQPADASNIQVSSAFYKAKPWPWLIRSFQGGVHHFLSRPLGFQLHIAKADVQRLQALQKQTGGLILAPNHANLADAFSLQELGRQTGIYPATMAALEDFDRKIANLPYQLVWPVVSRLGYFSVNPGNQSLKQSNAYAQALLQQGQKPLCIFPEGRVTWSNHAIGPCRNGAMRYALQSAQANDKPVSVVPIGIYYQYSEKARYRLEKMLNRQEKSVRTVFPKMTLPALPSNGTAQARIERLLNAVLSHWEQQAHLPKASPSASPSNRIEAIQQAALGKLNQIYHLQPRQPNDPHQQIRHLFQAINQQQVQKKKPTGFSWLNQFSTAWKQYRQHRKETQGHIQTLRDLEVLLSHQQTLPLKTDLTSQLETLSRLNCLILGKRPDIISIVRNCSAQVKVGNPIVVDPSTVKPGLPLIEQANQLTHQLQNELQQAVQAAKRQKALPPPGLV